MNTFIIVVFCVFLTINFLGSFSAWIRSKSNKEYGLRLVDTLISAGLIFGFIHLLEGIV